LRKGEETKDTEMSRWIEGFVSIRFDIDVGPVVEDVVPSECITPAGLKQIAQVAFPDCNPDCRHDFIYFFTLADVTSSAAARGLLAPLAKLLGAVYYRQKRDPAVPRGYVQQAVISLSRLPYLLVHELILRVVAPRFCQSCSLSPDTDRTPVASSLALAPTTLFPPDASFCPSHNTQRDVLARAFDEILRWPSPHPQVRYSVSLMNQALLFTTPPRHHVASRLCEVCPRSPVLLDDRVTLLGQRDGEWQSQQFLPLHGLLSAHIDNLSKVWELIISHQHMAILSNTPSCACAAALAVVALVMPIRFDGDLRTYLTVQDGSFAAMTRLGKGGEVFPATHSIVVAATNPFFVRAFSGWRNVMSVRDGYAVSALGSGGPEGQLATSSPAAHGSSPPSPPLGSQRPGLPAAAGGGWNSLQWCFTDTFESPFPFVVDHADATSTIRSRLEMAARLPAHVSAASVEVNPLKQLTLCDETLRKYFASLTMEFLSPVNLWFQSIACRQRPFYLSAAAGSATAAAIVNSLFSPQAFLDYLKENRKTVAPPFLRTRGQYSQYKLLYERFCGGVLFTSWITTLVEQHVRQELASFSAEKWAEDVPDSQERIDVFISLHSLCAKELETLDPDVVLVTMGTAALAEMALLIHEPFREQFLSKVGRLRL
jgi:hypothetical protein